MSSEHSGDMIEAAAYSVDELREALFEGRGRLERPVALGLLARKDYPDKIADLERILTNEGEVPRLRVMAAGALGAIQEPAAVRALERGVRTEEGVTLRGVAKALALVGTRKHIAILEDLARRPGPVGREAHKAFGALAERLKLQGGGRDQQGPVLPIEQTGETTPIRIGKPADKVVAEIIKSVPARKLTRASAVSMTCQGRQFVFAFDEESFGRGIGMYRRGGEVGIVAEPRQLEGTGWEPRYRVAVEPGEEGTFTVLVTTHDGRPLLAGPGQVEGREATFHLAAVDAPGIVPVEIRGRFDGQRLVFERALSAVRRRPPRLPLEVPTKPG